MAGGEWAQVPQFRRQGSFTLQPPSHQGSFSAFTEPPFPSIPSPLEPREAEPQGHTEVRPVLRPALQLGHAGGWGRWAGQRTPTGEQQEGPVLTLIVWSVGGHGPCSPPPAHAVQRGPGRTLPGLQSRGRAELCRDLVPGGQGPWFRAPPGPGLDALCSHKGLSAPIVHVRSLRLP